MKTLFFDCTNGISGDMMLKALMELSGQRESIEEALRSENLSSHDHGHDYDHDHDHHGHRRHHDHEEHHHHGRSWYEVREIINGSSFSDAAKVIAISIYQNIAEAEAQVHGETLETIHFHEVGRDEAIKNALGIGMALETIKSGRQREVLKSGSQVDNSEDNQGDSQVLEILTSPIYDGKGTIVCSHGEIPVPVPAVQALMQKCSYDFRTADVETEMVTPSGLASLMGIGAKPSEKTLQEILRKPDDYVGTNKHCSGGSGGAKASDGDMSTETRAGLITQTEARGSRVTGRDGLRAYLIEVDTAQ